MECTTANIPVFIVNLSRDTVKKEHMQALCERFHLSAEFVRAVDGRLLSDAEIEVSYSKARVVKQFDRELSRSEIGCALSHKKIYQKMVDERIGRALILEDDVVFNDDLLKILDGVNHFPDNWNTILLGHHSEKGRDIETLYSFLGRKKLNKQHSFVRPTECACGTYGYIVNLDAATILLDDLKVIYKPIDHYTGVDQALNLYTVNPAVITPHDFLSDHCHSMHERNQMQSSNRLNKKTTIKRHILNSLHLHGIAVKLRNKVIRIKHRMKKPRKY